MCGRYTLATPDPRDLRARFQISESIEIRRRFNVAPGDDVLAVTTDREGARRGDVLRWGLVPSWAEQPDTGLKMINARIETAAEKPAFRTAMQRFRCLIIADGFYEWRRMAAGPKQAFWITRGDGEPFAFAGLWSIWHPRAESPGEDAGGRLRTCTILTTAANSAIASLHDRMPVILPRGAEAAWLDTSNPAAALSDLLAGLPPEETALQSVGPAVNDARYDGPECLAPPPQSAQAALF
jgi:putative SOS response-associated peptidase YedK